MLSAMLATFGKSFPFSFCSQPTHFISFGFNPDDGRVTSKKTLFSKETEFLILIDRACIVFERRLGLQKVMKLIFFLQTKLTNKNKFTIIEPNRPDTSLEPNQNSETHMDQKSKNKIWINHHF